MTAKSLHLVSRVPSSARVAVVKEPNAPSGYRVVYNRETRKPRKGEIVRLVQQFLINYFQNELEENLRHETLDLYDLQAVIGYKLGCWLGGLLNVAEGFYYIPPNTIAKVLRRTEVDGAYFDIIGDTIRLMDKSEPPPLATVKLQLKK